MAQVHPSRAAFIPQDDLKPVFNDRGSNRDREYNTRNRGRSRSRSPPSRRSHSPNRRRERSRERRRDYSSERRDTERLGGQRHNRSNNPSPRNQRSRSRDGRNSPSYEAYRQRIASGEQDNGGGGQPQNNWQRNYQQGSGYTPGPSFGGQRGFRGDAGAGGGDFFAERRRRRDAMTLDIWPPSPKEPPRSVSPDGRRDRDKHSSKDKGRDKAKDRDKRRDSDRRKRKRSRFPSSSSETDSSEEEGRREKRRRKDREQRSRSRERHRSRRNSRSPASPQRSVGESKDEMEEEALWVEKKATTKTMPPPPVPISIAQANWADMNEEDEEIGPKPPQKSRDRVDEREYGGALLRGEGSAMAAFLQENARIPRRGEIGLTSEEIAAYEEVGYVMSGSRHRRMNAVRIRKENQVISAEEKRGILKLQKEERERREELLKAEFRELVEEQLGSIGAAKK